MYEGNYFCWIKKINLYVLETDKNKESSVTLLTTGRCETDS